MKIAITGASGKTGFRIVEEATESGYKVKQIVRNNSIVPENLRNIETTRLSLDDKEALDNVLNNFNINRFKLFASLLFSFCLDILFYK